MPTATELMQSIVERHAALGLDSNTDPAALPADASPHAIGYAAARRLGFIPADAEVVASAWQRQSDRSGRFDPDAWPCEPADFGIPAGPRIDAFAPCPPALGLYAVLPSAEWVGRMARAGLPTVQLRFKSQDAAAVRAEIRAAVEAVQGTASLLFINDHWREAIAAGAYGVHLGQEDLDTLTASELAEIRDAGLRLGLSTHGYAEMLRADTVGPSYLALGAVFPTTLKAMATPPQGTGRLQAYARLMRSRSLVAIGGIGAEQLPEVAASGVGSFAVVRAITGAEQPEAAAAALQQRWDSLRAAQAGQGR
ncbi:thiamine phosphate synthase [Malikia granosa]|uniref:Thiamine phosphate synthase n=1 Tax=Malikia granosa TaxID=263067 RepID=A0A2S9K531_9BURK|nr:thiamine phosphate synthase [Malikia granosa]PRD65576.1 thiamine phosphate synthase [Malikia granosa]